MLAASGITRLVRRLAPAVASVLVATATACSGAGPQPLADGPAAAPAATATGSAAPTADDRDLDRLWVDLWAAITSPDQAEAWDKVAGFVTPDQISRLKATFAEQAGSRVGHNTARTTTGAGQVRIDDCLTQTRPDQVLGGLHFVGEVTGAPGSWTLQHLSLAGKDLYTSTCVPAAVNDGVLAAYRDFAIQETALAAAPDPASPLIDQLTTGAYRQTFRAFLADMKAKGEHAVPFTPAVALNGEVYRYSEGQASVTDCVNAFDQYGRFAADGRRLTAALQPGTTSLYELDFILEEGRWKVADLRMTPAAACVKKPSSRAVTVVG